MKKIVSFLLCAIMVLSVFSFQISEDSEVKAINDKLEGHSPISLGNDFCAHIRQTVSGLYVTDKNNNVCVTKGVFDNTQVWHFVRQSNGAYTIRNIASDKFMDVDNANYSDGTNIKTYQNTSHEAQQFFIYYISGNFYIKSLGDKTVDVDAKTQNVQIHGCSTGIAEKETAPIIFNAKSFEILKLQLDYSSWNFNFGMEYTGYIRNWHSGLFMTAVGDNVVFKTATYANDQKWHITRNEYGGHIIKSVSTGNVLDVYGASIDHGADVNLYTQNNSKAQTFFFIDTGETRVYIKPSYSSTVLDMDANNHELHACSYGVQPENLIAQVFEIITENHLAYDGTARQPVYFGDKVTAKITLASSGEVLTDNTTEALMKRDMGNYRQEWTFQYDKNWNAYTIIGVSGNVLDVSAAGYSNGTKVSLFQSNGTVAQKFRFYPCEAGYLISPVHTQKLVDVTGEDGMTLQLYDTVPGANNKFFITISSIDGQKCLNLGEQFDSYIQNKASGLYLTGQSSGTLSCTTTTSKWRFIRQSNGSYVIKSNTFGKVLDVAGGSVNNGTNIQLYSANNSLAQSFFIYSSNGGYVLRAANGGGAIDMDASTKAVHTYIGGTSQAQINARTFILEGIALKADSDYSKENTYIKKVPEKTSVSQLLSQFGTDGLSVLDKDGNQTTKDTLCGTGSSVNLVYGEKTVSSASVVVYGDVDGNGIIDTTDYLRIKSSFLGTLKLDGIYFTAADVDGSNIIDTTDYMRIKGSFLGTYDLNYTDPAYDKITENQGTNLKKDPKLDNVPSEILNYLKNNKYILKWKNSTSDTVSRLEFSANVVLHTGFYENFAYYYPTGDYSDLSRFTDDAKFAEIAVNQGYLKKPQNKNFRPSDNITYEEVIRGYLYALGYREYADQEGYLKLAQSIGLTEHIDSKKALFDSVSYGEYAQIVYNSLHLPLTLCIEVDGKYYTTAKSGLYMVDTYIKRTDAASKTSMIFKLANSGWDIFNPSSSVGYKYGPSIIINDDGSIDLWAASHSGIYREVDYGTLRTSYDGGKTWTADRNAVQPTEGTEDWNWTCDPGIIKIGDWYYAAYTSTLWHDGLDNNLYVARSKKPEGPFVEKWTGNGWGNFTKPIATYDGDKTKWGAGEGSFVVLGNTLYIYYTWTCDSGNYTKVCTAPANDPNWPAKITYHEIAFNRDGGGEDSADVKYVDAYNQFVSVSTAERFSDRCYINIRTSFDGKYFRKEAAINHRDAGSNLITHIHNMGISGDDKGHIDIFKQNYVSFAHQPKGSTWGSWPTRFVPIVWYGTHLYDKPSSVVQHKDGLTLDTGSSPQVCGTRILNAWNDRVFRFQSTSDEMFFYIQQQYASGLWEGIPDHEYANVVFYYDPSIVSIDINSRRIKLLSPQIHVVKFTYKNQMGYFTAAPDYAYHDGPIEFYAEKPVITFTKKGEVKQPGFVANGSSGDHLILWGNLSSYTDANTKDQPEYIRRWHQGVSLSGWDNKIISVDTKTGKITAKAVGETTITATYMGKSAKIKIVVEVV